MIKVSVEVREGAALFRMVVQAESICQAVSIMKGHHPDGDVRVVFPIAPEEFFVKGPKKTGAVSDTGWATVDVDNRLTEIRYKGSAVSSPPRRSN